MAYKCLECGHIFEDGEQFWWEEAHGFADGRREKFSGCPVCKGAYEKTSPCKRCMTERTEEEIYGGMCINCLRDSVSVESAMEYLRDRKLIVNFVFYMVFKVDEPATSSEALEEWCECIARQSATRETMLEYIIDTDEEWAEDFANWLNAKEVK